MTQERGFLCAGAAGLLLALVPASGAARGEEVRLGRIEFPTSGSPEARKHFLRGALLLHSFEYPDAAEEFGKAEEAEPGFAMAYWGEAMTHNHPLWIEENRDAARKILERLGPTPAGRLAKAPTEREKMYLAAVEALYGDGDRAARDRAYAEAMGKLHGRFPDDPDAAAFHALALLGTTEGRRDFATYMKAAAIVEEVFAKNPEHPGAAHYLIHCYDDPVHAPLGMRAARVYAKIAPAAVHALHMPSHIFFASGMWEEAIASNEASWKASVDRAESKKLGAGEHSFHALSWLEYAYLQGGRYRDARRTLATMEEDWKAAGSSRAADSLAAMRAAWIVETRRCSEDVLPRSEAAAGRGAARDSFLRGLCALASGDLAGAEKALAAMAAPAAASGEAHAHGGGAMSYGGGDREAAAAVLRKELAAKLALARRRGDEAVKLAREAAAAEDAMSFEFGPPVVVKPAHELAGEILLDLGRPAEARKEFELSLARAPRRALSLLGLARAASKAGEAEVARRAYGELREVWRRADADLPELSELPPL